MLAVQSSGVVVQVEDELAGLSPNKDALLAVGVFDGFHLGHKYLISQLVERAKQQNLLSGVVTFQQHPRGILSPRTKLSFLTNLTERVNLLKNEGVEVIVALSFTRELAELTARQFVGLLKKYLRMRGMVIGPDFALGQNREGNIDTLRTLGEDMGFSVTMVPPIMINGEMVSSTNIRKAIADGDIKKAVRLIGHSFSLQGRVITGVGRGMELGFPTANLDINSEQILPADGVYATRAYIDGKPYQSMTNIGKRPTFGGKGRTIEVFILDYQGGLYERELKIDIVERLRDEKRFNTDEELKRQIAEDIEQGKAILDSQGSH
ncbi:bifunctional riboflavin kinase/FAD synthetase [Chloroflexota bacterium]